MTRVEIDGVDLGSFDLDAPATGCRSASVTFELVGGDLGALFRQLPPPPSPPFFLDRENDMTITGTMGGFAGDGSFWFNVDDASWRQMKREDADDAAGRWADDGGAA